MFYGYPMIKTIVVGIEGLPEPEDGTVYIVSRLVYEHIKYSRDDLVCVGEVFKDDDGKKFILGWGGDWLPAYGGNMDEYSDKGESYEPSSDTSLGERE